MTSSTNARVVLVTGASSGIGRAATRLLLARGDNVALLSRHRPTLEQVADGHPNALVVPADVVDRDGLAAAVAETVAHFGRLDAVIHSAQVMAYGRIEDVDPDVYDRVVDVAMKGTANLARTVLPRFREAGTGTLVIVNSLLGEIATPRMGAYDASKWGQLGLARVLQLEVRDEKRVHVCVVSPGAVDTPIYDQAANYAGKGGFPPPPVVSPDRVAQAALDCLDRPRRQVEVGPVNQLTKLGFRTMPFVFDRIVGPMVKLAVFRGAPSAPNAGNVLEPDADLEATTGGWTVLGTRRKRSR
jgi:NAD(P)-dependent dehydrogenase (short-subunit alcohol dehydrogenase family)